MIKLKGTGTITIDDIKHVRLKYPNDDMCIVIENTKYQYPENLEAIAREDSKITFSILGGLNPEKQKFNSEHYQKRTYYKPLELSKIIRVYQSIERGINLSWNDTQKVMYIYQQLCNHMVYSECMVNGRDCARGLIGLLYGKAVCSGFGMIFKEAMDRLGFQNVYQNRLGHHSWNLVYLDGNYRAFELTWDVYNKSKDGCIFAYFNLDGNFYENEHHNLSGEQEEQKYKIVPYTRDELIHNYQVINSPKILHFDIQNGRTQEIKFLGKKIYFIKSNEELHINGIEYKRFIRNDGSTFILVYAGTKEKLNNYFYFVENNNQIIGTRIHSEVRLDALSSEYNQVIADGLLSRERLKRKIKGFNGYVGYFGTNHQIYYNSDFEREKLNIAR